jgi:anti-sigma regulatory factor (Ser/Thr protein kinase)
MRNLTASSTFYTASSAQPTWSASIDTAIRIRRAEHAHLAALLSSVGYSRLFVRQICASWHIEQDQIDVIELLASELVSNAITASGVTEPRPVRSLPYADLQLIGFRLLALDDSLVIEVWDTSLRPPRLLDSAEISEHGRGLQLVDALSIRWGYYHAPISGKVVWCELALDAAGLEPGAEDDTEAFERVLKALEAHPWEAHALTTTSYSIHEPATPPTPKGH